MSMPLDIRILETTTRHMWTALEEKKLRDLYKRQAPPSEFVRWLPNLTARQISNKAGYLGLTSKSTRRDLGIPPIDAIRRQAESLGWTLRELDRRAKTGRYFQRTTRHIDWAQLAKAIEVLGGTIELRWPGNL